MITESAQNDLREIVEFVARDDPRAAERLGEKLIARAMSLRGCTETQQRVILSGVPPPLRCP